MTKLSEVQVSQNSSKTRTCYKNKLKLRPMTEGYATIHAQKEAYNGGRSLRAAWTNPNLTTHQLVFILCITSHLDFKKDFKSWIKISINLIAAETRLGERTIHKIISQLVKSGYLEKRKNFSHKTFFQEENSYRLTNKLFDEHVEYLQKSLAVLHNEHVKAYKYQKSLKKNKKEAILHSAALTEQPCTPCIPALHLVQGGYAPDADILPLDLSPLKLSHSNSPMCEEEKNSQTDEKNIIAQKSNNSELKQTGIVICELLKQKQRRKFIPNMECEMLIAKSKIHLNLNSYDKFLSFAKAAISNESYNKLNSSDGIENTFILEMKNFIDNENYLSSFKLKEIVNDKKEILDQAANQFKSPQQKIIEHSLSKFHSNNLKALTSKEITKLSSINELSELAKEWYKSLNSTSKQMVVKEIRKYGSEKFSKIILPSIKSFQNFERSTGVAS